LAAALLGAAVFAGPAHAVGIGLNGPLDPSFSWPTWYEDAIGQRLVPCLDGPQCLATIERPDPGAPVSFPNNFPVEQFWFEADTVIGDALAPQAILVMGQEGAFGGATGDVVDGEQVAFGRLRIRVFGGLETGKIYRVTHPYGVDEFVAGAPPRQINFTDDIGCFAFPCSLADYAALSGSRIGPNFLQWDTRVSMPPAGFIGDSTVMHEVVGSPFNTNFFKIEEITGLKGTPVRTVMFTDKFTVQGQLAPGSAPVAWLSVPSTSDAGSQLLGGTTAAKTVAVANSGAGPLALQGITLGGDNAGDFALDTSACGATLAPAQACNLSYTFTPSAAGTRSATVTVASNVGPQTIALTGTGTAPAPAPAAPVAAAPAPVVEQPRPAAPQPTPRLRLDALTVSNRMSLRTARRRGLSIVVFAPEGAKVVKVRLLRNGHVIARSVRKVAGDGVITVVLPSTKKERSKLRRGTYKVQVTPGQSTAHYGVTSTRTVRVR
jgi:hypothetical protein